MRIQTRQSHSKIFTVLSSSVECRDSDQKVPDNVVNQKQTNNTLLKYTRKKANDMVIPKKRASFEKAQKRKIIIAAKKLICL
jgi:hypothetical protein